jgi:hypothetical protein
LQWARQREHPEAFKARYAKRAGIEGKPRHDLRYTSVHFSRPYRSVKGEGGETLTDSISTCLFVGCFLMPTFCNFCRPFMPLWGEREMVRFAARRTADDDPPSHL